MAMQLKKDMEAMGQLEEMLCKYGPVQVVDTLKECLVAWAETARDGIELHDEKAIRAAEIEAARLLQASEVLGAALPALRRLGL
jgi:hypothetical protein